jgi:uncharacterized delta-60 repeat protein
MGARATAALLATVSLLALAPGAQGAAGFPDPSFGNGGFTAVDDPLDINEQLRDVVIQADGKIVGGGGRGPSSGFLLARLNPDGTPDAGFGAGGIRVEPDTNVEGAPRSISELAQRSDGKILAAGLGRNAEGKNAFEFARYGADGTLDPLFGVAGLLMVPVSPTGFALGMDLAPDQKLVGVGGNGEGKEAVVVRVTEDGHADETFNAVPAGIRTLNIPGSGVDEARAVQVLGDGTILFGGLATGLGVFLAELDSSGSPVAGFGAAGIAVHDLSAGGTTSGAIEDIEVLADGRILATGYSGVGENSEIFVARFTPSGDLDPSFGTGGVLRHDPTAGIDEGKALAVLADGRIIAAGFRGELGPGTGDTMLIRLRPDGQLDPAFGTGGEAVASGGAGLDKAQGVALQPDGRAVIAGFADEPGGRRLMFGRFTADDPPASPPTALRCRGRAATIVGTARGDRLRGTKRRDVIVALAGNDRIFGAAGNDLICGGPGAEVIKGGRGSDTALGQAGRDILTGGAARDLLLGGVGGDRLFGNAGPDRLLGGVGNDRLVGGKGRRDLCNGGAGPRDRNRGGCERLKRLP